MLPDARTPWVRRKIVRSWVARLALGLVPVVLVSAIQHPSYAAPKKGHDLPDLPKQSAPAKGKALELKARKQDNPTRDAALTAPPTVRWPSGGEADLSPQSAAATVGGMRVRVKQAPSARTAAATTGKVRVKVLDRAAAARLGTSGPVVAVGGGAGQAGVELSYADFAGSYGGDYGARLRLVKLPDCALTTPDLPRCQTATPVPAAVNDTAAQTVTATVDAPATTMSVFALEAGDTSVQGDYSATKLTASSKWDVALATGGLTWNYPIRTPSTPGGLAPEIALAYSSQSVDGRTSNTNNQGSWIGEGFTYEPGYIERRYKPCADDGHKNVGDQCWARENASIVLGGISSELVKVSDDVFKLANDDGTKIERKVGATNGDDDGEHWLVTTPSGTQFSFGLNRLPGWAAGKDETNSTWTAPVSGDDSGEPCYKSSGWEDSFCDQAWRWNLDYVKDTHNNVISYFYKKEINYYAKKAKTDVDGTKYVRGGYLYRADYGQVDGQVYTTSAPARVVFDVAERCIPTGTMTCQEADLTDSTASSWPDTPWDLNCKESTHCKISESAESFWTRKRLNTITTEIRTGTTWTPVERWTLNHSFTDNGDGSRSLWLNKIDHTGLYGGTVTTPPVELVGIQMDNRVDSADDMLSELKRYRLNTIYTETGGAIQINYTPAECSPGNVPTEGSSTKRCFPVKWNPFDPEKVHTDWFHKYLVAQIIQVDRTGGSPDQVTQYEYPADSAAWRKTPADGITKAEYRTWGDWRGYPKVTVRTGDMQTLPTKVEHVFFRGMDGDDKPGDDTGTRSVSIKDSTGAEHTDANELAGQELETITYDGNRIVAKAINDPKYWITKTQTESWGTRKAYMVRPEISRNLTALAPDAQGDPVWRETKSTTTYDTTWGRPTVVDDLGDVSTTADDTCTRTTYADNSDRYMYTYPKLVETFSVKCTVTPNRATQLLSSDRTSYDGQDYGVAPTKGDGTRSEALETDNGTTTTYLATNTVVDGFGRPTKVTDPMGYVTDTAYTDVDGFNVQVKETNALTQSTTTEYSPAYGQKLAVTDANLKRTDLEYDGLGRLTKAWLPTRPKSAGNTPELKYTYTVRTDKPVTTKTETIRNDGTYKVSYQLFDGFLRDRQTQSEGPSGGWMLTDTLYTSTGQKAQTNNTYFATGTPGDKVIIVPEGSVNGQIKYLYDGVNREIAEITAVAGDEKWRETTRYHGDRTDVIPPAGGTPTTTVVDAKGQTTALYQYKGKTASGEADITGYTYTADGQQETVTGPDKAVWRFEYYQNGRKKKNIDPDAGELTFYYDKNGNATSTVDSRTITVSSVYDKLDRKTETWQGAPNTGTKLAAWVYDSYYKGQLTGTARYVNGKTYAISYPQRDAQYRPLKTSYSIPSDAGTELAKVYDFSTTYNIDGTTQTVGMPAAGDLAGESVTIGYDTLQRPTTLTGATSYVTASNYANTGELLQATLQTGTTGKKVWQTYTYERGTNRLTAIRLDRQNAPIVDMDAHYNYDAAGNVLSIADTPAGTTADIQCFTYDNLRRLTEAWSTASTATDPCANGDVAASGVGGSAPYHQKWFLYASGDRKSETTYSTTGGPETTRTYQYPPAGQPQPHTLRQVDETTGTATKTYTYTPDSTGNTQTLDRAGQQQSLTWDAEGHLATSTRDGKTTSYVYDADGNRLVSKEPAATTLYLDGMEIRLNLTSRQVNATRFYEFSDRMIAVRTGAGVNFQTADAHGTTAASVDAMTGAINWRRTTPYGEARGAQPATWPDRKGFVGGTIDDITGFTHLGAREYDPTIGRFISLDPEFDSSDPQSLSGYLYSNNSPLTFTDPTGRSWGWAAVAAVAIVVVAVVVVVAFPAAAPALYMAGAAAVEAATMTAATGATAGVVATSAAVAGAAELSIAGGAALGAGVAATGLTVAGAGGRIYSGTENGPAMNFGPKKPQLPPLAAGQVDKNAPYPKGTGYGPNDEPQRIQGPWTEQDIRGKGAWGYQPEHLADDPEIHHADQMPGSPIHELDWQTHRGKGSDLHRNKVSQEPRKREKTMNEYRKEDTQLHWWYRSMEMGWGNFWPTRWFSNWDEYHSRNL
ncbi:hypothetical protein GCM10010112_25970 [Actinoplanes lobatus]|uniref:RHS repeat-associated protein n=1 Tax=Actinoplanes lobatus TaxID=113568 RepID=A0A7W7MIP3_9ACTN|nr:RHS repeat-associated core domain-containing protein [Actinoplanes lobatus]MBB4751638.1 RHS repeat-associated protein [Actinoplanes lobatus]GGN65066.1 hypothetical protein GCM10010112_25970 [Actinoplanes lobatus]GIE43222.1 hypothetical protein Alo02nite_61200 [Actinoplanes lobatus]